MMRDGPALGAKRQITIALVGVHHADQHEILNLVDILEECWKIILC